MTDQSGSAEAYEALNMIKLMCVSEKPDMANSVMEGSQDCT